MASVEYFLDDPRGFWAFYSARFKFMLSAKPNAAHFALAELERMGLIKAVITQNVDGLHSAAGSVKVIEIHGSSRTVRCSRCGGARASFEDALRLYEETSEPPPLLVWWDL